MPENSASRVFTVVVGVGAVLFLTAAWAAVAAVVPSTPPGAQAAWLSVGRTDWIQIGIAGTYVALLGAALWQTHLAAEQARASRQAADAASAHATDVLDAARELAVSAADAATAAWRGVYEREHVQAAQRATAVSAVAEAMRATMESPLPPSMSSSADHTTLPDAQAALGPMLQLAPIGLSSAGTKQVLEAVFAAQHAVATANALQSGRSEHGGGPQSCGACGSIRRAVNQARLLVEAARRVVGTDLAEAERERDALAAVRSTVVRRSS